MQVTFRILLALLLSGAAAARAGDYDYLYPVDPTYERPQVDAPPLVIPGPRNVTADPLPALDVNSRASVRAFYKTMWEDMTYPDFAQHWTGSYDAKHPGDLTTTWRKLLLGRLNAFRALAGVPVYAGTNKNWDDYAQDAAFAGSINDVLSHQLTPEKSPLYWTRRAAVGAAGSSISAAFGAKETILPIDDFICDFDAANKNVGHRIHLLTPTGPYVGIGHVPYWGNRRDARSANDTISSCAVMNGYDLTDTAGNPDGAMRDRFVAWPSRGFFPRQLLTTARWSVSNDMFSPSANFGHAIVEVYRDGQKLASSGSPGGLSLVTLVDPAQENTGIHPWNTHPTLYAAKATNYPDWPDRDVRFTVRVRNLTEFFGSAAVPDYIYNVVVFDALAEPTAAKTLVPVPEVPAGQKFVGDAQLVLEDIRHPNGNVYDQLLLTGSQATFTADPGQITRLSYVDLNDDIVQVEMSGAGRVHIELANASGPARPVNYAQDVAYMKGHARLYVLDSDSTTHLNVFSVGRGNAVNQSLFKAGVVYDGVADIALVAIASIRGQMGGVLLGNAGFFATSGFTGLYAPGVAIATGVCRVHDIRAEADALPVLLTGAVPEISITGGSLAQANAWPVMLGDATTVAFRAGATSHAGAGVADLPRQANAATLLRNDADVTAAVVR